LLAKFSQDIHHKFLQCRVHKVQLYSTLYCCITLLLFFRPDVTMGAGELFRLSGNLSKISMSACSFIPLYTKCYFQLIRTMIPTYFYKSHSEPQICSDDDDTQTLFPLPCKLSTFSKSKALKAVYIPLRI